ncbi:hypothetical protein DV736_g5260, partial [Chaetothyriales sp. CBS 134916]
MAAICIAIPVAGRDEDVYGLQKIQRSSATTLDDPDFLSFLCNPSPASPSGRRAEWRSSSPLHTALPSTSTNNNPPSWRCKTSSTSTHLIPNAHNAYIRASVLVADLLAQIASVKQGPDPKTAQVLNDDKRDDKAVTEPDGHENEHATVSVKYDSSAPAPVPRSTSTAPMDFDFGFGDPAHMQTRGKKKKAAKAAQQADCWADDVINNANGEDDWTTGFTKKEKKKKGKKAAEGPPPTAPDPPDFQDISLDDSAPKLDFSFSGSDKKDAGGFGAWGNTWDFGLNDTTADKPGEKAKKNKDKDENTTLGDNNPWSFGSKSKSKKTTGAATAGGFDFGDLGSTTKNQFSFDGDLDDHDATDNAWGFSKKNATDEKEDDEFYLNSKDDNSWSAPTKKDKKNAKKGAVEYSLPSASPAPTGSVPQPPAEDEWSSFGFNKKEKKKSKKAAETSAPTPPDEPGAAAETSFDWGIGPSKKDKTKAKSLIAELDETSATSVQPTAINSLEDDDWMKGAWGKKASTKKDKKTTEDLSTSTKLEKTKAEKTEDNQDDDIWGSLAAVTNQKARKAKKGLVEEEQVRALSSDPAPAAMDDVVASLGTKSKIKDKKGKKMKDAEPEPLTEELDLDRESVKEEPADDTWGFGLSAKDKKKKEREAAKKAKAEPAKEPDPDPDAAPAASIEEDVLGAWALPTKEKKKREKDAKKKSVLDPVVEADTEVLPEANPLDEFDAVGWGLSAKDKKKKEKEAKKKSPIDPIVGTDHEVLQEDNPVDEFDSAKKGKKNKVEEDPLPPAPTPPAQGLTPEAKTLDLLDDDDLVDDTWAGLGASKSKASTKKGTLSRTSTKDSTKSKEKDKDPEPKSLEEKAAEEKAAKEEEEKNAKKSKGKLGKTSSKTTTDTKKKAAEKAATEDPSVDILSPASAKDAKNATPGKLSKTSSKEEKAAEKKDDDSFGFGWGAASTSKKTTGKKDAESKKEIKSKDLANEDDALLDLTNDLDGGFSIGDEPASSSKKAMKTDKKVVVTSSVKDRIKQLEAKKEEALGTKSKVAANVAKESPPPKDAPSPKEKATVSKPKTATAKDSKTASKRRDLVSPVEEVKSRDSVPGSFPDAFEDDMLGASVLPEKPKAKINKLAEAKAGKAKATATKKASKPDADLLMAEAPEPPKLPTPPPEEKKAAKKERPRVDRSGASSWGFWGVAPAPKKSTKEKVASSSPPPPSQKKERSPPALTRSKSTKTSKDKEKGKEKEDKQDADKASKSSSSEKEAKPKKAERPSKASRGTSFSNFMFGGPPPSAMKKSASTRRSSTAGGSRSSSRSRVEGAPPSPPPESEVEMNDKAAKLLGTKSGKVTRKASVKPTKSKGNNDVGGIYPVSVNTAAVPDPYPIDSDDMVMINAPDDTPPKESKSKSKTKLSSSQTKASKSKDKEVRAITSFRRDSVARPSWSPDFTKEVQADGRVSYKQLPKRSNTMSQDEDVVMVDANDKAEPLVTSGPDDMAFVDHPPALKRTNTSSRRASAGFFGSLFGAAAPKIEEPRPRSQTLTTDDQDYGVPIRTKSSSRRKSKVVDADEFTNDAPAETDAERGERRAKKEEREDAERADREARRRERREREKSDLEARRSKARDKERKEREAEEARRDERRARQKSSSRRHSSALVEEYHSSRDGAKKGHLSHVPDTGKTSSWVNSQADDPPDLPPVEETILDPAGELPRRAEEGRSERRRVDKYAGMTDAEIEQARRERRKSRREKIEKSVASGGSGGGRRPADYDDYPFDPKPELKRGDSRRRSLLGAFF